LKPYLIDQRPTDTIARPGDAVDEAITERIRYTNEYDLDGAGFLQQLRVAGEPRATLGACQIASR
jgi:hypothetical protein